MMIQKLGPNSVLPQRFAYFTQSDAVLSNKAVSGADAFTDSWIDAFAIAGLLKKTILGRPFCSMIAREVPGVVNKGAHPVLSG